MSEQAVGGTAVKAANPVNSLATQRTAEKQSIEMATKTSNRQAS